MEVSKIRQQILQFGSSKDVSKLRDVSRDFRNISIRYGELQHEEFFNDILLLDSFDIFEKYSLNKHLIVFIYGIYSEDFIDYCITYDEKLLILLLEQILVLGDQQKQAVASGVDGTFTLPFDLNQKVILLWTPMVVALNHGKRELAERSRDLLLSTITGRSKIELNRTEDSVKVDPIELSPNLVLSSTPLKFYLRDQLQNI
jgi:hypothetical protein